jgi:hypothetical protein
MVFGSLGGMLGEICYLRENWIRNWIQVFAGETPVLENAKKSWIQKLL